MAAMVREVVGPDSPVVVIFDLQANISDASSLSDLICRYVTIGEMVLVAAAS
jgi:microcystin degradation protein MlrC